MNLEHELHRGVITAVVHVTCLRPPSSAAVAAAFDAAQRAVYECLEMRRTSDLLRSVFGAGLSLSVLKALRQHRIEAKQLLSEFCSQEVSADLGPQQSALYVELVIEAARAALNAEIEDVQTRIGSRERAALEDVRRAFQNA